MKIWICGVDGMMGSHMKRLLAHLEIPHVGTNRKKLDILQFDSVSDFVRVQKISHIINCAAYTHVDKAETEQKEAYLANAMGPHHLGIAARRHGARVIHFSTDYVFGKSLYSYTPVKKHSPYIEEDSCAPLGAYGMSKLAGEIKLLDEHQHVCVIRTSWLFGFPGKNFVNTMTQLLCAKKEVQVVNDQIGRPTYCQDLAEITVKLLEFSIMLTPLKQIGMLLHKRSTVNCNKWGYQF
jgi:dTDP-4-dehydrorhamnose reductase